MVFAMQIDLTLLGHSFVSILRRPLRTLALLASLAALTALVAQAQVQPQPLPAEAYGPYNATFLINGPGLTKPQAPPSALDPRTADLRTELAGNNPCNLEGGCTERS